MEKTAIKSFQTRVIALTGGGTGGHIYPNLALVPELKRRGFDVAYVGAEGDTLERRLAAENGLDYYAVPTIKLIRSLSPAAIKNDLAIPHTLSKAVKAAKAALQTIRPQAVFSKGGFVSLPAVLAAKKLGIPVFAHESDLTLGLANRIAKTTGATMLKANPHSRFNAIQVGMPLRESLFKVSRADARRRLGIVTQKPVLLVLGGSSGAQFLNEATTSMLDALASRFFVLHVTGKQVDPPHHADYLAFKYAERIEDFYAACDIALSRAGATAVFELSALRKRALFLPLPKGISRGDQLDNAALAEELGAGVIWQDKNFFDSLLPSLETTMQNAPMRAIADDANGKIADIICDSLRRGEKCKDKKPSPNGLR